ncbi:MAG: TIGR00725 family protein [Pseudanabaena sp. CRU_2_10]|nr:TIGR00725 family protein [Pseudanabaena sp. CRU_2_10]
MPKIIIGVMGPGRDATTVDLHHAYELGQLIAQEQWIVLSGGLNLGVMAAVSKGAKSVGGMTIGILPGADRQFMSEFIDIPVITGMGSARNNINILSSDVVIACGMSTGTASEVALALRAGKKVILLSENANENAVENRFWQYLGADLVAIAQHPEHAIALTKDLLAAS